MKKIIRKLFLKQYSNSETYVRYLRKKGAIIGDNVYFLSPNNKPVDEKRIRHFMCGDNVVICSGVKIIIHDYSWENLRKTHGEILPSWGGKVKIGDNVFIGIGTIILKDCKIGNNVIIGAGSVVTQSIPDNCVCAGNPCKIICSMDEYYEKRKKLLLNEAVILYKEIKEEKKSTPSRYDMAWFSYLFSSVEERKKILKKLSVIGDSKQEVYDLFLNERQIFKNYDDFIEYADKQNIQFKFKSEIK